MISDETEETIIINPTEMTFLFHLSDKECHQKHTGICSLERRQPDRTQDIGDECDYDYCPKLLKAIKQNHPRVYILPIELANYSCGHYAFNDGQHRICIAKKKKLRVPALIENLNEECDFCKGGSLGKDAELR